MCGTYLYVYLLNKNVTVAYKFNPQNVITTPIFTGVSNNWANVKNKVQHTSVSMFRVI